MPDVALTFKVREDGSVDTVVGRMEAAMQRAQKTAASTATAITQSLQGAQQKAAGAQTAGMGFGAPGKSAAEQLAERTARLYAAGGGIDPLAEAVQVETAVGRKNAAMRQARGETDKTEMSERALKEAVRNTAMMFGSVSPELALVSLELSQLREEMAGMPPAAKAAALGTIGLGLAVAGVVSHFERLEEKARVLAEIHRAAGTFDLGALQGGAGQTAIGIETTVRRLDSPVGMMMEGLKNIGSTIETAWNFYTMNGQGKSKTTLEEQQERMEEFRKGIAQVQPFAMGIESAQARIKRYQAESSRADQAMNTAMQFGSARPETVEGITTVKEQASRGRYAAEREQISLEERKTRAEAEARGTLDIEEPAIKERYANRRRILATEEAQEAEAIRTMRLTNLRTLAQQELTDQTAIAKEGMVRRLALVELEMSSESALRQADSQIRMAQVRGEGTQRARAQQAIEYDAVRAGIEAAQQGSEAKTREAEQLRARLVGILQGQLAQNLISERDYTNQVRTLDNDLATAKMSSLKEYSSALTAALSKAAGDYARYTDQVRQLDKDIRQTKMGTADAVAEIGKPA